MGLTKFILRSIVVLLIMCSCQKEVEHKRILNDVFIGYCDNNVKTSIDNELNTHWTSGDKISLFRSTTNEKFSFVGSESSPESLFSKEVASELPTELFKHNYAVYPYRDDNYCDKEGELHVTIPSVQQYAKGSFAPNVSVMASVTENIDDKVLRFRNACGFIRVKIYGGDPISKIYLTGNNNEKIVGTGVVNIDGNYPLNISMDDSALESIELDCGETGVGTGKLVLCNT